MLKDKELWKRARESEEYKLLRDKLMEEYKMDCEGQDIPLIKFSDEFEFLKNGNRTRFQDVYFLRRRQLSIYATLAMLYPEKEEYIEKIEDLICEICNEYSWVLPAHRSAAWFNKRDTIDLFVAETSMNLAEIKYILAERLNPLVVERITNEIKWRVFDSFENETQGFENLSNNWAAVCGCGVGVTYMYESPERFNKVRDRIEKCMSNYMNFICDDGSTSEGIHYWQYGFSYYVMYYEMWRRYTFGRYNKFSNPKVTRVAKFFSSLMLDDNNFASFGDSGMDQYVCLWLQYFLKQEYGIEAFPAEECVYELRQLPSVLRAFIYYTPGVEQKKIEEKITHFEELQWYINKKAQYGFAIKGGKNDEERDHHNHNDIGSFIVVNNGKQVLCDLGSGEYTREYFSAKRYMYLNTSSLGHSVPIIEGKEQGTGGIYEGRLEVGEKCISVDMKKAYPTAIKKLLRKFELGEEGLVLTDAFDKGLDITERFVTRIKPVIENNSIIIDKTRISFPDDWKVECKCEYTTIGPEDTRMKEVYLIDFTPTEETDMFKMEIGFCE